MKKWLSFLILAGIFTISVEAQRWVNFSSNDPRAPECKVLTSNAQNVRFEVTLPGIYTQDTTVNSMVFTRLMFPGVGTVNPVGAPEIPVLTYTVAVPECSDISVETLIKSSKSMLSCLVYPLP